MPLKYRLSLLGWYNFELLTQALLKQVIGPGVSAFGGSQDDGRDAGFQGKANFPSETGPWDGNWIFQVKSIDYEERGSPHARKALISEFTKEAGGISERRKRVYGSLDNYVLVTNVPLTAGNRDSLEASAKSAMPSTRFAVLDGKDVCQFLDAFPQIRRAYPQLLCLADLDVIVNKEVYSRSQAYLASWQTRLSTFVRTEVYDEALNKLRGRHFLVLDGPPETGKSMIGAALALSHATVGVEIIDLRDSSDFFKIHDSEKEQLFIADDAIGSIALDPSLAQSWSKDLPGIVTKLGPRHLLVWTARKYVLEEALLETRVGEAVDGFKLNEVLVEVGKLTSSEKAAILYNHAKAADLSIEQRSLIRENARAIVTHPNYTPERIRQLIQRLKDEV